MDSSPDDVYYDTNTQAADEEDSSDDMEPKQRDSNHVYFELEDCNDDEISQEEKYQTAKGFTMSNFKKTVADRLKMFDKRPPKGEVTSSSSSQIPSGDAGNQPSISTVDSKTFRNSNPAYGKLWEGFTRPEKQIYSIAEPITSASSEQIASPQMSSSISLPSLLCSKETSSNHKSTNQNEYCLESSVPPPLPLSPPPIDNRDKRKSKSVFYLSTPLYPNSSSSSVDSLKSSANRGCQQGVGSAVPVDFIHPVQDKKESDNSEYARLYFQSTGADKPPTPSMRQKLKERGYHTIGSFRNEIGRKPSIQKSNPLIDDSDVSEEEYDLSFDWGSEFDDISYQESIDDLFEHERQPQEQEDYGSPDKPLPPKPIKGKFGYQDLIPKPLRPSSPTNELEHVDLTSSAVCLPVNINLSKHPPPSLPSPPEGLSDQQKKRRCVVDLIISSEKSYLESLERILKQYERAIVEAIPNPKARVRVVLSVTREIISHHKMFQIELSEAVATWDQEEKIGDIFTASFSKTMVVNAYSIYVNNFSAAMEEIRTAQRSKHSFDEFLRDREKSNSDRLSIFGLMVKPVQRFPQFIMCLQDLIKYIPPDHADRRALQLALTELENVTHMLNERKRCSEQRFQALQTIHQLIRQKAKHMLTGWSLDMNTNRRLLRYDSVEQVFGEFESMKCKDRRLILMNDLVLCVKVIEKEQSGFRVERLGLRWMAKLKDLELKDTAITPEMHSIVKKEPGKIHIISSQLDRQNGEKAEEDPFHLYADLSEMLHDYTILGQITSLTSTLKRSYAGHGLTEELVHEISRDLQQMIQIKDEQLRLVNSCSLVLVDHSRSDKPHYVIQTKTAAIKQDWSIDFLMAKLAQDRSNSPAWDRSHSSDDLEFDSMPAHFMKHVPVDVPRNYTKTRCAVSVFLTPEKSPSGLGVQHLWVCSSTNTRGQVSILSIHNSKPSLTESFRACDCEINSVELVPGCGEITSPEQFLFVEDTVWMTSANQEILVFPLSNSSGVRRDPLITISAPAVVVAIKFVDERVFCGLDNGSMAVYSRQSDGSWNMYNPTILTFGSSHVKIHFVSEEDLWISCSNNLYIIEIDSLETKVDQLLHADHETFIDHVTRAGMGIWVSFTNSDFLKLFHVETLENLQEMSIGHFLRRIAAEKLWSLNPISEDIQVTSLASSKGLLWIGTNLGVVLTLTLPRLSDGVPLYRGRPSVSLHAHRCPVKFLMPLVCASNTMELKRSSTLVSTLRSRPSRRNMERERLEMEESERNRTSGEFVPSLERETSIVEEDSFGEENFKEDERSQSNSVSNHADDGDCNAAGYGCGAFDDNSDEVVYVDFNTSRQSNFTENLQIKKDNPVLKAMDDDPVALRKRGSKEYSSTRSRKGYRNLSFRSELAQRIIVQSQRLSGSCSDLVSSDPLEVEVLYENLLEDDNTLMDRVSSSSSTTGASHTLGRFNSSSFKRSLSSTLPSFKKSNKQQNNSSSLLQSVSELSKREKKLSKSDSKTGGSQTSVLKSPTSPLPASEVRLSEDAPRPEIPSRQPRLSSASQNSCLSRSDTMRGTMRKSGGTNAVIVLSGGDGYRDLNSSRSQSRTDDASIMLWIYKF